MTTFTDMLIGVHWYEKELFDERERVGRVTRTLAGEHLGWVADPYWDEPMQFFDNEDEAKAWLVAMYRMEGSAKDERRTN